MPSLGQAYIEIHSQSGSYQAELEAQVKAATKAVEANNKIRPNGDAKAAALAARAVASAEAAAYREAGLRERSDARTNQAGITADRQAASLARRAIASAEARAYTEAAKLERDAAKAAQTVEISGFGAYTAAIGNAHGALSKLSTAFTELPVEGKIAVAVLAIGTLETAAVGAITAVGAAIGTALSVVGLISAAGIQDSKALLEATLGSAKAAQGVVDQLFSVSNATGAPVAGLAAVTAQLIALGEASPAATAQVAIFADALTNSGVHGAALATDLASLGSAFEAVARGASFNASSIDTFTAVLPGLSRGRVFKQLAEDLGLTVTQVKALAAAGKVSDAQGLRALLEAAQATPAAPEGISAAFDKAKTQITNALGKAFDDPKITAGIDSIGATLVGVITKVAPQVEADFGKVLTFAQKAIGPFGDLLGKSLTEAGKAIDAIGPTITSIISATDKFFTSATTKGTAANDILKGTEAFFGDIVAAIKIFTPFVKNIINIMADVFRVVEKVSPGFKDFAHNIEKTLTPFGALLDLLLRNKVTMAILGGVATALGEGFRLVGDAIKFLVVGPLDLLFGAVRIAAKVLGDLAAGAAKLHVPGAAAAAHDFRDAATAVGQFHDAINGIPDSKTVNIDVNVVTRQTDPFASSTNGELPGSIAAEGTGDLAKTSADAANAAAASIIPNFTGGGGGGGDSAAKAAADKIKTAFAALSGDFKAIAHDTSAQTADAIRSEFDALVKDLDASGNKALDKIAKTTEAKLISLAGKLKAAQDKLSAELAIGQGVKDSVIGSGSIDAGSGIATTFAGIQNKLRFSVANTQQFITAIKKLQAEKLNRTSIQQLVDNFSSDPAGALAEAQALISAGQAGITGAGGINDLQGQLTGLGNSLGNDVAGELYKAGQHVGDGLLEGLKSKEKALEKLMNKIGDDLSKNLKKRVKAHSPSEVFADIGGDVVDGLVKGLDSRATKVSDAAGRMSSSVIHNNFHAGAVAVTGGTPRPETTGLMIGHGIVGVLERQQALAMVQGIG